VEIELRREIMVRSRASAQKMARYSPVITAPKPKRIAQKLRFPVTGQRQSLNQKRQIRPSMHD
jgi:hypothetical protein